MFNIDASMDKMADKITAGIQDGIASAMSGMTKDLQGSLDNVGEDITAGVGKSISNSISNIDFGIGSGISDISNAIREGLENGITNSTEGITANTEQILINFNEILLQISGTINVIMIGMIISLILSAIGLVFFIYTIVLWSKYLRLSIKVNKKTLAKLENEEKLLQKIEANVESDIKNLDE